MKSENLLSKKQKEVLHKLVRLFRRENIKYAISGGLASIIYGASNRKLFDIDVLTNKRGIKKITKLFKGYKVKEEILNKRQDLKNFSVNFIALDINGVLVDIAEDENAFAINKGKKFRIPIKLKDAKEVIFTGIRFKVRPLEELIIQRLAIGRVIDRKDVAAIMSSNKIDFGYLEKRAREVKIWSKIRLFKIINSYDKK